MIKLDYTLTTPEERLELVNKFLEENPDPGERYLEILADYLVLCMEKQEKKEKRILTENRKATINKRETSFEGLASQFENGEDGVYDLIVENNKNVIFKPKISITKEDLENIPELRQVREAIEDWEKKLKTASGRDAFIIKKAIIDLRKDQYLIKDAYRCPVQIMNTAHTRWPIQLNGYNTLDENGYCVPHGVTLTSPAVCSAILCDYQRLRTSADSGNFGETWALMEDFDQLRGRALANFPIYRAIVQGKILGYQNNDIQKVLEREFGVLHSLEYISTLWRKKIPNLIASAAEDQFLDYYYLEVEYGKYKKCNRCGRIKLAHNKYFSKNKTSKDGFYSICKECRSTNWAKDNKDQLTMF